MPIVRLDEVREMTSEQRLQKITELKTELSKIRTLINAGGSFENPVRAKATRKEMAGMETGIAEEAFKQ